MRILQIGKFYPIRGGVEKVMWDLTKGLAERGIDCDMLCAKLPGDEVDEADKKYVVEGFDGLMFGEHGRVIFAKAYAKVAATMMSPALIWKCRKLIREAKKSGNPYSLIHVHHPDPMAAVALLLSGWRGKVVLHWHSDILKQKGLLKLYMPLQKWLIKRADLIVGTTPVYVTNSPFLQSAQDKVTYLPIGTDMGDCSKPFVDNFCCECDKKTIIYSMGRLVEYKGYKYLVEAAKYLPEDYLVVIGGGGPLKDELLAEIEELGLTGKVILLGRVPDEDVEGWYRRSDVFVLSSIMRTEAFGIVQIEAMSYGKPVVATKIPGSGTSWVNEDGVSGRNVEICDAKAIADAILEIENDYAKYSEGARKRYEKLFTASAMIDRCTEIYKQVLHETEQ